MDYPQSIILHITTAAQWQKAQTLGEYHSDSLDNEGFIHCSTIAQVIPIANTFYSGQTDLIVLFIDSEKLISLVKWEEPVHPSSETILENSKQEKFPHVYGVINLDAVKKIVPLSLNSQNSLYLPLEIE